MPASYGAENQLLVYISLHEKRGVCCLLLSASPNGICTFPNSADV